MCIAKHIALFAKTDREYIKHLESLLLEQESDYTRCSVCGRVDFTDQMGREDDCGTYTCSQRCRDEYQSHAEHESDDYNKDMESNYEWAKYGPY